MTSIPVHPDPETDNRTIPAEPLPFPSQVNGSYVVAAALFPARRGEKPNLAHVVLRNPHTVTPDPLQQFVAITASAGKDDGEWSFFEGVYDCSYTNAMEIFMERLNHKI